MLFLSFCFIVRVTYSRKGTVRGKQNTYKIKEQLTVFTTMFSYVVMLAL